MKPKLVTAFAAGIGSIWALAFIVGIVTRDYTALGIVTPVMLVAAGAVFAVTRIPIRDRSRDD